MRFFSDLGAGLKEWRVWWLLALRDITLRYRRSVLGPFWISASLVAMVLALSLLYSTILKEDFQEYVIYLAYGFFAWQLINTSMTDGCNAVIEHEAILVNRAMPLSSTAARIIARNAIIFAHHAVGITAVVVLLGGRPSLLTPLAFVGAGVIMLFAFFAALSLGPLSARFRDIPEVIKSVMQVLFFVTPIIWTVTPETRRLSIIDINPFYHFIELVRAPMMGQLPTAMNWWASGATVLATMILAVLVVNASYRRVAVWV